MLQYGYMQKMAINELSLEREIKENFSVCTEVGQMILFNAPAGRSAHASLFLAEKKQLYLYVTAQAKLNLGDVKKIVSRMGLKADIYLPPKGRPDYFNDIAIQKFIEVFPGRKNIHNDDLIYYKTLVSYNPALVLISEIKDGHVYQYDADSNINWRVGAKFAYRRIKTS